METDSSAMTSSGLNTKELYSEYLQHIYQYFCEKDFLFLCETMEFLYDIDPGSLQIVQVNELCCKRV